MGCDIHAHIEVVQPNGFVREVARIEIARNYRLFSALAGVRQQGDESYDVPEPKGLPDNMAMFLKDELLEHADHSFSWASTDELATALARTNEGEVRVAKAALLMMQALETSGIGSPRMIYGFDS